MSIAKLGKTSLLSYESKNGASGLTDVRVIIRRADGVLLGPFIMSEYRTGFYVYALSTTLSDPEGDYLAFIESPSENNYKTQVKVTFLGDLSSGGGGDISPSSLIGIINSSTLKGALKSTDRVLGTVYENKISGKVEKSKNFHLILKSNTLKGVIKCRQ